MKWRRQTPGNGGSPGKIIIIEKRNKKKRERAMYGWEKSFDSVALMRAKAIDGSRVTITKKDETHIDAAVMSVGRVEVSITLRDGVPCIMKCKCPKARGGRKCEHMAAVLYKIEQTRKTAAKGAEASAQITETKQTETGINELQKLWDMSVVNGAPDADADANADKMTEERAAAQTQEPAPKKRGRKSKAQLEAERMAAEEAKKQAEKEETERRIAERKAEKAAAKAERRRRRQEAQEAQRKAREEEDARRAEEERRQQEETARRESEEKRRREEEEKRKREQREDTMRKRKRK